MDEWLHTELAQVGNLSFHFPIPESSFPFFITSLHLSPFLSALVLLESCILETIITTTYNDIQGGLPRHILQSVDALYIYTNSVNFFLGRLFYRNQRRLCRSKAIQVFSMISVHRAMDLSSCPVC